LQVDRANFKLTVKIPFILILISSFDFSICLISILLFIPLEVVVVQLFSLKFLISNFFFSAPFL